MSKSKLIAFFATGAVLASQIGVATPAYAASRPAYYGTHIYASGSLVSSPSHIDAKDSGNLTAFLPLFYVNQALAKFGITGTWDGNNWDLILPQGMNADMSNPQTGQQTNSSTLSLSINGQVVQYASRQVVGDPANGGQSTTYLPIWYIDQVIGRLAIQAIWDGTNWKMTRTTPETQSAMAEAMWNVFGGINWDVNAHPSVSEVGINSSPTSTVTASDVATYLTNWAAKAKGETASDGPNKGKWMPYSLQYEASSDPYTWANINGLFQGTSVTSPSSAVSQSDANTIISNLKWWLTGDRVVNGIHHLHVPFYSNYGMWLTKTTPEPNGNGVSEANYQSYLADETKYYDEIMATVSGSTVNLTLPKTLNSASNMAWNIVDGQWVYGGWRTSDNKGGKTIQMPKYSGVGISFVIDTATLNPNMYLEGFQVAYVNSNGAPVFSQPVDFGENQSLPND